MFASGAQQKRWHLSELMAAMRAECMGREGSLDVYDACWEPFTTLAESDPNFRRVHLCTSKPLGSGGFGFVVAAFISLPQLAIDKGELCFTPVAMKTTCIPYHHVSETLMMLSLNDLVTAGLTPGINRLVDAFCTNDVHHECCSPPASWTIFWDSLGLFVRRNATLIRQSTSPGAVQGGTMAPHTTLGFLFSELSLTSLVAPPNVRTSSPSRLVPPGPRGTTTGHRMLADVFQRIQIVAALHEVDVVHCDIHTGNFITHRTGAFRTAACRLGNATSDAVITRYFGKSATDRPDDGFRDAAASRYYAVPLDPMTHADRGRCIALGPDVPHVALIDFGACIRCTVRRGTPMRHARQKVAPLITLPTNIVSSEKFKYDPDELMRRFGVDGIADPTPAFTLIRRPTTFYVTRPPEQLNPNLRWSDTYTIHSELSDVYSVAATAVAVILGYHPFGSRLVVNVQRCTGSLGLLARAESGGRTVRIQESVHPAMYGTFDTDYESRHRNDDADRLASREEGDRWFRPSTDTTHTDVMVRYFERLRGVACSQAEVWTGTGQERRDMCASFMARVMAVGMPPKHMTADTLFAPVLDQVQTRGLTRGWLYPTLLRVLSNHHRLAVPQAHDFCDLLVNALAWDPACRPSAQRLLQCTVFASLGIDMGEHRLRLQQLWSIETPRASTWPMEKAPILMSPCHVVPLDRQIVAGQPPTYSERAREGARPSARFKQRYLDHNQLPGLLSKRFARAQHICPHQAYLVYYFNMVMGALDMFDAAPLVRTHKEDGQRRCFRTEAREMRGQFRSRETLELHVEALIERSARHQIPAWWQHRKRSRDEEPVTPSNKRPRLHAEPMTPPSPQLIV